MWEILKELPTEADLICDIVGEYVKAGKIQYWENATELEKMFSRAWFGTQLRKHPTFRSMIDKREKIESGEIPVEWRWDEARNCWVKLERMF